MTRAIERMNLPLRRAPACFGNSDHGVFWLYRRPAVGVFQKFVPEGLDPCFKKPCDASDRINYAFLSDLAIASREAVRSVADREELFPEDSSARDP